MVEFSADSVKRLRDDPVKRGILDRLAGQGFKFSGFDDGSITVEPASLLNCKVLTDDLLPQLVADLNALEKVCIVNLRRAPITDRSLNDLKTLSYLELLELNFTQLTPAAVAELQAACPDTYIDYSPPGEEVDHLDKSDASGKLNKAPSSPDLGPARRRHTRQELQISFRGRKMGRIVTDCEASNPRLDVRGELPQIRLVLLPELSLRDDEMYDDEMYDDEMYDDEMYDDEMYDVSWTEDRAAGHEKFVWRPETPEENAEAMAFYLGAHTPAYLPGHSTVDDIYLVSNHIQPVSAASVDELEAEIGTLPTAFRELMFRCGSSGMLDDFIYLKSPAQIMAEEPDNRATFTYEFYLDCFPCLHPLEESDFERVWSICSSVEGDAYIYFPRFPGELFLFPRHDQFITRIPTGFADPTALIQNPLLRAPTPYFVPSAPPGSKERLIRQADRVRCLTTQSTDFGASVVNRYWSNLGGEVRTERQPHDDTVLVFVKRIGGYVSVQRDPVHEEGYLFADIKHEVSAATEVAQFLQRFSSLITEETKTRKAP